ncbi:unnamed protein product [Clonostachys rhizophaga]|uniref:Zn(2)-C6 fungal-type domain-containing protein n=1 Tax=Clonostachys rhizophaga TaxID=160324 RepID=A0A9N9V095_9HYPO|nr:unnamed protein product [Clonostachys rhizophaga]
MTRATGCWTCRVRHVKCDSETPSCRECSSRQTNCHGYGPRPVWMDGGTLEAAERSRIKASIKENFRRVRKRQNQSRQRSRVPQPAAQAEPQFRGTDARRARFASEDRLLSPSIPLLQSITYSLDSITAYDNLQQLACDTSPASEPILFYPAADNVALFRQPTASEDNSVGNNAYEASLLMHYFDQVFPWQFPYHNPQSRTGNRGWLLQLLTKRGPLYYATISLSSLHQNAMRGINQESLQSQKAYDRHSTALQELCEFLRSEKSAELHQDELLLAEFLACSTMLMSFEVLGGGQSDWEPHLNAVYSIIIPKPPTTFLDSECWKTDNHMCYPSEDLPHLKTCGTSAGLEFLYANAIWFDIISCVSTGKAPVLPYKSWLAIKKLKMEDVMGCNNRILSLIGDIAQLRLWKEDMDKQGLLSARELVGRGQGIESQLEEEIMKLSSEKDEVCPLPNVFPTVMKSQANWISHIFALGALVQVHTIVSGPLPYLPEIQRTVQKCIDLLSARPCRCSLQGMVWPLCVLGCMAEPQSQSFFEELVSNMDKEYKGLGNSSTVLQIMRGCWGLQMGGRKDCTAAMSELNIHALLV